MDGLRRAAGDLIWGLWLAGSAAAEIAAVGERLRGHRRAALVDLRAAVVLGSAVVIGGNRRRRKQRMDSAASGTAGSRGLRRAAWPRPLAALGGFAAGRHRVGFSADGTQCVGTLVVLSVILRRRFFFLLPAAIRNHGLDLSHRCAWVGYPFLFHKF